MHHVLNFVREMAILLSVLFSWSFILGYFFQVSFITTSFLFLACPAWFALQEKGDATLVDVLFQEVAVFAGALMAHYFVSVYRIERFWLYSHWPGLISSIIFSSLLIGATLGWHFWREQEWSFLVIAGIVLFVTFFSYIFGPYDTFRLGPSATRGNNHFWLAVGLVVPIVTTGTISWAFKTTQLFYFAVSVCVLVGLTQLYNVACNVLFKRLAVSSSPGKDQDEEEITFEDVVALLATVRSRTVKFAPSWNFSIDQVD